MRVNFEIKYGADNLDQAKATAYEEVAKFMNVAEAAVTEMVDLELKVASVDPEKDKHLEGDFAITAYGHIKQGIVRPL